MNPTMTQFTPLQSTMQTNEPIAPTVSKLHDAIFYPYNVHRYATDGKSVFWAVDSDNASLPIQFLPAEPSHKIAKTWDKKKVGLAIAELLEESNILFDAIDCVRRRQTSSKVGHNDDHTVVVTVRTLPVVTSSLTELLQEIHELTGGLSVEIRQGRVGLLSSCPAVGSSIGIKGSSDSNGTIGGFFNLLRKDGNVVAQCALVCEHVVRPYITVSNGEIPRPAPENMEPYRRKEKESGRIEQIHCVSPSEASLLGTVACNRKVLVRLAGELLAYKQGVIEMPLPEEQRELEKQKSRIQGNTTKAINRNSAFGSVYASSGHRFGPQNCRLDWALVEAGNAIPSNRMNRVENLNPLSNRINVRRILHAGKPRPSVHVYKKGSTTGTTCGVINPILSYVATYDANGKRNVTSELCVIPDEGFEHFAGPGDSGSLVLECVTAKLIGMVFGGHYEGGPAYFTSISVIAKNIKQVTGFHVQLPGGSFINNSR